MSGRIIAVEPQCELRYAPLDPPLKSDLERRIVRGTLMRYGDCMPGVHGMDAEVFEPKSLHGEDIILNVQHDRARPIARQGHGLELAFGERSVEMEATLPKIPAADEALDMVRAGLLKGLSVEFRAVEQHWNHSNPSTTLRVITSARLNGIGLVDKPAYPESIVRNIPDLIPVASPTWWW